MNSLTFAVPAFLATAMAVCAAPRLVVSTPSLVPESKIDLVLDLPVTETTELGKTTENNWLEITPPLPGKLKWKAQNIAEFQLSQSPAMGINYTFSIPKNRKHLDGTPVPAGKFTTLASEEFRIVSSTTTENRWSSDYSSSSTGWMMVFNDETDPVAAAGFVSFGSKAGQRVAARLERATMGRAGYHASNTRPWAARWGNQPVGEIAPETPAPHVLIAYPVSPLPPGDAWQLSVLKGLPNTNATARTKVDSQYEIGKIEPFRITEIKPRITANQPRKIVVSFNHPVNDKLPADFLAESVDITPRPENLQAIVDGREIEITGELTSVDKYSVTLKPPFTSRGGMLLEGAKSETITFEHLAPELALPSDNQAQLANGKRSYQVQTVNLASVQVRIKKLAGVDLIRAYQGYRHYTGSGHDGKEIQPTAPLPWSLLAGETIVDREIQLENGVDTSKDLMLSWDELLPKDLRNAALFLDVTGTPHPEAKADGRRNAQAIIQLTDIGLAWKFTAKEALVYAFSCETGAALPGVKIQLFGEDAAALDIATTDAAGLATVPRPENARHLIASLGTDSYLTAFDSTLATVGLWHFPVRYSWNTPAESSRQAFLFTDRSLYRPGETVRLKGIIRNLKGNAIEAAQAGPARIVIIDPTEKEILSQPVTISPNGSFDITHTLAPSKTGTHSIRLEFTEEIAKAGTEEESEMDWYAREMLLANARFEMPLHVEEFRRNAFEITQKIADPAIGATTVAADLSAKYYQGQPVASGLVKHYSRVTTKNLYPERFRDFQFGNHRSYDWGYWYHYFGYRGEDDSESTTHSSNLQGETQLSASGSAAISIEIPQADFPSPREVEISSEVTDANHQTLTARTSTTVHPASAYIGISRIDNLIRVGETVKLKVVAIDNAEQPFNESLKLTATLTREVNSTLKTLNQEGATTTRNDVSEETVVTSEFTLDPAASAKEGQDFTITPKSNGLHFLSIRGVDPKGRPFATVIRFHVYGTNEYPWLYEDGMRVKLVAEKKSYKPGETARVLVLSPIEGTALVTVEREKVLRSFSIQLKADNPVIEIPLTDDDAPNAYVSVLIVKGAKESSRNHKEPQLRLGYCELLVENQRDRLAVNIDLPSDSYRPGEQVTLTGTITVAGGKPAAGAEVTLYAEDEGTLAVMGYETPKPMDHFYKPRILGVEAGTSFESFISENPEMQDFHNKGFFVGGGGDLNKLADMLRKNFDPCATWAPVLVTDAAGKFSHTFHLPDTLTRYRVIAIAHHETSRFGHAESAIVAKKDLMLEPKAPRFANQTDTVSPQVLVQNASRYSGTWEVRYNAHAADGTPICRALAGTVETVSLAPGASATMVFPTMVEHTGEAVLTWSAKPVSLQDGTLNDDLTRRLSDAVEARFQVHYPMPLIRQVKFVKLDQPGNQLDLRKQLDQNLLDGTGSIDLEFARSPLAEAAGSIDYLLQYPYGCVEQTTSSLIPWCAVEDLRNVIPAFAKLPEKKVQEAIQAGADRLLSMQLPNGSFSYWPGSSDTVDWATPYAGLGLMMAASKDAKVPDAAIESLTQYLIGSLRGLGDTKSAYALESHARALLVLALAEKPQPAYQSAMIDRLADLTPSARSLLAAAIAQGNPNDVATAKQVMTSKVGFQLKNDDWMPYSADKALELIAWVSIDPKGPEALKTLDRMLNDRNPYGHWRTTWVNGWSLIAMGLYAEHEADRGESVAINLETNDGVEAIHLSPDKPTATRSLTLGPNMKLSVTADHAAFVRARIASKPPVAPIQPVAKNGLSIDRLYYRVNADGSVEPLTEPKPGDLIRVSLRVTLPNDDNRYLVIEDPLPAVFETVNTDFTSQSSALGVRTSENDWNISHSELRSDRAVFFLDHVWRKGTYTVTYLARCTLAGQAVAPPAKVESMYDPENFALSASRVFATK
jgi:alpha-2-macroglobulin